MCFNFRVSAVIPWVAYLLLIQGLAGDPQLLAQESDQGQSLEGLRPAEDSQSVEEASQDLTEKDLKKKSVNQTSARYGNSSRKSSGRRVNFLRIRTSHWLHVLHWSCDLAVVAVAYIVVATTVAEH